MSDMLQKLLGVEKAAASIVAEAEAEANRITAQARLEAQRRHSDLLKAKAAENEASVAEEKVRLEAERQKRIEAEREKLARLPVDVAAFRSRALEFIGKGER
jgi:vacuolar-type H+-ATPase subunit E/Vma4